MTNRRQLGGGMITHLPKLLSTPRTTIVESLIANAPTAVAAFHYIHQSSFVTGVRVVVACPQITQIIESQLLRIAKTGRIQFQIRTTGITPQNSATVRR